MPPGSENSLFAVDAGFDQTRADEFLDKVAKLSKGQKVLMQLEGITYSNSSGDLEVEVKASRADTLELSFSGHSELIKALSQ